MEVDPAATAGHVLVTIEYDPARSLVQVRVADDGGGISAAGLDFETREIPGHSGGHVVFVVQGVTPPVVFGGDVLFNGSIGRTDFPGGSFETLARGIREKLYGLPDETIVYPGHGPATTVGHEKRTNHFVKSESAR